MHDEIILEVSDRLAGEVAMIFKATMIQAGEAYLAGVPVKVLVAVGETWAEK